MFLFTSLRVCCLCLLSLPCESVTGVFFNAVPGTEKQCIYYRQDETSALNVIGPLAYKAIADRELMEGNIYYAAVGESPPGSCPSDLSNHAGSFPVSKDNVNIFGVTSNGTTNFWSAGRFDSDKDGQIDAFASKEYRIMFSNYAVGYSTCRALIKNAITGQAFVDVPAMGNGGHQYLTITGLTICRMPEELEMIWTCDGSEVSAINKTTWSEVCYGAVTDYMLVGIKPGLNGHPHDEFPLETFVVRSSLGCSTDCPTDAQIADISDTIFACFDRDGDGVLQVSEVLLWSGQTERTNELSVAADMTKAQLQEFYEKSGDVTVDYHLIFGSQWNAGSAQCPYDEAASQPVSLSMMKTAPATMYLAIPFVLIGIFV